MQKLEVEAKFELTAEAFERIKTLGRVCRREDQLNVYYDSQWRLADNAGTLRIRFIDGTVPTLTLKVPVTHYSGLRIMKEFELALTSRARASLPSFHPVSIEVERDLPAEIARYLRSFGVQHLQRVGWTRNTRIVLEIDRAGQIELDRLLLPDGTIVHEAEIETNDPAVQDQLAHVVLWAAPDACPSTISKFQRFRRALSCGARPAAAATVSR